MIIISFGCMGTEYTYVGTCSLLMMWVRGMMPGVLVVKVT